MNRPPEVRYNPGCLWAFAVGFFFLPAIFLAVLGAFSVSGGCAINWAGACIPSPDYAIAYFVLGGAFFLGGVAMSMWAAQQGKK